MYSNFNIIITYLIIFIMLIKNYTFYLRFKNTFRVQDILTYILYYFFISNNI